MPNFGAGWEGALEGHFVGISIITAEAPVPGVSERPADLLVQKRAFDHPFYHHDTQFPVRFAWALERGVARPRRPRQTEGKLPACRAQGQAGYVSHSCVPSLWSSAVTLNA